MQWRRLNGRWWTGLNPMKKIITCIWTFLICTQLNKFFSYKIDKNDKVYDNKENTRIVFIFKCCFTRFLRFWTDKWQEVIIHLCKKAVETVNCESNIIFQEEHFYKLSARAYKISFEIAENSLNIFYPPDCIESYLSEVLVSCFCRDQILTFICTFFSN